MPILYVENPVNLITFLISKFPEMKKNTIKDYISNGSILVNSKIQTKATLLLNIGDKIEISYNKRPLQNLYNLEILYSDPNLAVVIKPEGLLTIAAGTEGEATVVKILEKQFNGQRLFPCHRLDKGTSGILLMPKNIKTQEFFFSNWGETEKIYVAVVEGHLENDYGSINMPLLENPTSLAVSVSSHPKARSALTHYQVISRGQYHTLVEVRLETGRKHQIRVHMQYLGHPILGDDRYGKKNQVGRLCLHARKLSFPHPILDKQMSFEAAMPGLFTKLTR